MSMCLCMCVSIWKYRNVHVYHLFMCVSSCACVYVCMYGVLTHDLPECKLGGGAKGLYGT